jgi:hypothetical protein
MRENRFPPVSAGFLLDLLIGPEDGGDIFLRNVQLSLNYTALQHRRQYAPQPPL